MKKIQVYFLFSLISISLHSQIMPFLGIIDLDSCKFESPCYFTQLYPTPQNIWQIGRPQKPYFDSAFSPFNALVTDTINPYTTKNDSYFDLILPIEYGFGIIVGFKQKFQTDTLIDGGYIEDSYDHGNTWVNVIDDQSVHQIPMFNSENLYSHQNILQGGINGFSGNSGNWIYTRMQWIWGFPVKTSPPPDTLILRFHFISDSIQTNKAGWIIDNILISYADEGTIIQENENSHVDVNVLPNPFIDHTTISFNPSLKDPLSMILVNSLGKPVQRIDHIIGNQVQINKNDLPSGIYFIRFSEGSKILKARKLVIL